MRRKGKKNSNSILDVNQHGIDLPEWMWNMVGEGVARTPGISSRSAWIIFAITNQAKRDKFYKKYKDLFQKQLELEVKNEH